MSVPPNMRLVTVDDLHPDAPQTGLACMTCGKDIPVGAMCSESPLGMAGDSYVAEVICAECATTKWDDAGRQV